jgi:predicted DNA-binding transcriptional regulator AlpA
MDKNTNFNWLREYQVQALLGLKRTTLYKMRRANLIRFSQVGHTVFYDMVSIEEYLEANASKFSSPKNKLV